MELSPYSEANSCTADQEIPRLLCNPKVISCVKNISPLKPILNQFNPVHTLQ
jgi:hypothetical protein